MSKPTLADVARAAEVGVATVERVLNGRGGVSPPLVEKVVIAARKLGYGRRADFTRHGTIVIEVVMVRPDAPFFMRLKDAFTRVTASLDRMIVVHRTFLDENDPRGVAAYIAKPGFRRSGLIIVAPDHPEIHAALMSARDAGVSVVRIVSRSSSRDDLPFVGIDNYAAGRTAALLMSQMRETQPGCFVALCHGGEYFAHRQRIQGFGDYLLKRRRAKHRFTLVMQGRDDVRLSASLFDDALAANSRIIGVYNAGGANSAIASTLERHRKRRRLVWVGHELTAETTSYLKSGLMDVVLDQAPETQARRAIDTVLKRIGFIDAEVSDEPVRFYTITSENL